MIFFTGCTHFNHPNIIKYCERPYPDIGSMERDMIWKWNKKVSYNDTVYHLGDFGFGSPQLLKIFLEHLNGRKIIIKGNHDHMSLKRMREIGWDDASKKRRRVWTDSLGQLDLTHRPIKDMRVLEECDWNIHAHTHQTYVMSWEKRIHVGVDSWNFEPVSEWELLEYLLGKGLAV